MIIGGVFLMKGENSMNSSWVGPAFHCNTNPDTVSEKAQLQNLRVGLSIIRASLTETSQRVLRVNGYTLEIEQSSVR